mgnify:FL=1
MILRKPYGFLIKHFRLIHLIISAILGYIAVKYYQVYGFIKKCIIDTVNRYDAGMYTNYNIYIFILLGIMLFFVVYWLLKYKDKPRRVYISAIVGYILVGIILFLVYSYMSGFSANAIDQKTLRLYRDILFIGSLFQYYIIIIMIIRGLGFDIKKFNFSKDVQELNLTDEDMEEVEVNVGIDTTNILRGVRKQKREFGYFFQEYRWYIIIILVLLIGFLGYRGYRYYQDKYKIYNENEYVGVNKYIRVKESYYDIDNSNNYIIVKINTYKAGVKERINTGNILLDINGVRYTVDKNVCYKYSDIGTCYKQQYISDTEGEYILVYPVNGLNIDNSYIIYSDGEEKIFKIKLNLRNNESD